MIRFPIVARTSPDGALGASSKTGALRDAGPHSSRPGLGGRSERPTCCPGSGALHPVTRLTHDKPTRGSDAHVPRQPHCDLATRSPWGLPLASKLPDSGLEDRTQAAAQKAWDCQGLGQPGCHHLAALWFPAAGSERGSDGCLVLECTVSEWLWLDTSCLGRKPPW